MHRESLDQASAALPNDATLVSELPPLASAIEADPCTETWDGI
ncbi:hypothetical protein SAMN05216553_110221 [Lentzea fradiae]|uniref:Uncharacterized protein n=1 Tax=Lentzea fradiae TaxID=200378 RepID=A0A1G7W899_9PSEU|nr:hypothetical protein SAMN05216553_110221 [Lentzea fradiae]